MEGCQKLAGKKLTLKEKEMPNMLEMQSLEAKVRGIYLAIACDFERLMDDLIILCDEDACKMAPEKMDSHRIGITHLKMGKKLKSCREGLKEYSDDYFQSFQGHFDIIAKLVKYRNILAHGYSDYIFGTADSSCIDFTYVFEGKKYCERIYPGPFIFEIEGYRSTILELMGLTIELRNDRFRVNR